MTAAAESHQVIATGEGRCSYRGITILARGKGTKYYEADITWNVTQQYRAEFFATVTRFELRANTRKSVIADIDDLFATGDLA